jgi:hypothetical protein
MLQKSMMPDKNINTWGILNFWSMRFLDKIGLAILSKITTREHYCL